MDDMIRERRLLRPSWSFESSGKGIKRINRKIARARLKRNDLKAAQRNWE